MLTNDPRTYLYFIFLIFIQISEPGACVGGTYIHTYPWTHACLHVFSDLRYRKNCL
uniref:Uncharacterized protein n=1 Tax=Octopus bimaculoides TaxID=37653 RepID=A0A0L8IE12_OCTBM